MHLDKEIIFIIDSCNFDKNYFKLSRTEVFYLLE